MIEVTDLWKSYGRTEVLKGISFSIPTGAIAGFLGPNGAGKTTTMRILTTFFPVDRGVVRVAGHDVSLEPTAVCEKVGYLPESLPIYPELRVSEFLRYRATLRGLSRRRARERVDAVIEECGLTSVPRKLLGALSRGYRQRLGLADALLHDPEILILDEPTAGLDPRQVVEVRRTIEGFRGRRTVLLSSHILGEVEQVCDVVVILHQGQIQAQESRDSWQDRVQHSSRLRMVIENGSPKIAKRIGSQPGVLDVSHDGDSFEIKFDRDLRATMFELAKQEGWSLLELTPVNATLESLFLELTGEPSAPAQVSGDGGRRSA